MNKNQQNEITNTGVDTKLLSSLVVEFNIARRNFRSYPQDHPIIDISLNKVIEIYDLLLSRETEVVIGVARDTLMVNGLLLDKNNLVFRDFAKTLFEHGIAALLLHRGLNADELRNFNRILCLKRDEIQKQGGISSLWEQAGITSLEIKPIRYDLFSFTEDFSDVDEEGEQHSQGLWERFVRRLVQGKYVAGEFDEFFEDAGNDDEIDPQLLAEILNRQLSPADYNRTKEFSNWANTLFAEMTRDRTGTSALVEIPYEKLAIFISNLNPELRRQFLCSSFDIANLGSSSLAEEIIPRLSTSTLDETLEDIRQNRFTAPPMIMKILQKLSLHAEQQQAATKADLDDESEIHQRIRNIFREHADEDFVPGSYQEKLEKLMSLEKLRLFEDYPVSDLLDTLDSHCIENQISDIILQMMVLGDDPEQIDMLVNNLFEIYFYLLQTGDYDQLIRLLEQGDHPGIPTVIWDRMRHNYTSAKCLDEVIVGLKTWGKPRYNDITRMIGIIGEPFIEVLLDSLADEENLSLRRFLMDRIQEFGVLALGAITARLTDSRWYVLRNLIIMLRIMNDSSVLEHVRPLLNNANQRVSQEALRCCLQYRDPAAERQILYDMDSPDRETQLAAIHLAEKSRSLDVFRKLLAIIAKSGFSSIECELKSAAVLSLAEIGRTDALPELARVLASRSLLNSRALARLKIDIVRSLSHYPTSVVLPILKKLAAGSGEVSRQATESLKMMAEKTS